MDDHALTGLGIGGAQRAEQALEVAASPDEGQPVRDPDAALVIEELVGGRLCGRQGATEVVDGRDERSERRPVRVQAQEMPRCVVPLREGLPGAGHRVHDGLPFAQRPVEGGS